ncbi:hypothetical protein Y032_0133g1790 [Ancylostoma ceylanicum]|uniref:Uncharacterized protein n=1 Tax=Ancylostoma ceylanicum TaxID=53326 RepID=A0A016T6K6_9BILA|nr:hypothetical protein Y032_0133g1790 [Ancylostoma ceylanicum]
MALGPFSPATLRIIRTDSLELFYHFSCRNISSSRGSFNPIESFLLVTCVIFGSRSTTSRAIFIDSCLFRAFETFECGAFNNLDISTTLFPPSAMRIIAELKSFLDRIYNANKWLLECVVETGSSYEKKKPNELPSHNFLLPRNIRF